MRRSVRWLGLIVFLGAIGQLLVWWLRLPASASAHGGIRAATIDLLLFSAFALHHSVLARTPMKRLMTRGVPPDLVRTAYVLVASALLVAMCLRWQPIGGQMYRLGGAAAVAGVLLQWAGVVVGVLAVRRIDLGELSGVSDPKPAERLQCMGPFRYVRHPLYLGWVLMVFGAPLMTVDRLLFAAVSTAYLLIAMPFEEAGLVTQFGSDYLEYRQQVRWRLIPYVH
jgi:protein-S-isoprenylcysteine O-methyltransferase Ste14